MFDLLADPATNMLRAEYQTDEYDAHPNELANQAVGPLFVSFIDRTREGDTGLDSLNEKRLPALTCFRLRYHIAR